MKLVYTFRAERDHIAQSGRHQTTVAAMDWAIGEIERLQTNRDRLRTALAQCLGLLCESGDLNNYRNLSDAELGKAWIETAKEAATVLNETGEECDATARHDLRA